MSPPRVYITPAESPHEQKTALFPSRSIFARHFNAGRGPSLCAVSDVYLNLFMRSPVAFLLRILRGAVYGQIYVLPPSEARSRSRIYLLQEVLLLLRLCSPRTLQANPAFAFGGTFFMLVSRPHRIQLPTGAVSSRIAQRFDWKDAISRRLQALRTKVSRVETDKAVSSATETNHVSLWGLIHSRENDSQKER